MARPQSLIEGRWRIVETELWDQAALDLVVPAYMRFDRSGLGEMELIAIGASIDYRVEQRDGVFVLEFSWSGFDEMDATSGRNESTFVARRERGVRRVSTSKASRPPRGAAPHSQRGRPRQRGFRTSGGRTSEVPGEAPAQCVPVTEDWE